MASFSTCLLRKRGGKSERLMSGGANTSLIEGSFTNSARRGRKRDCFSFANSLTIEERQTIYAPPSIMPRN